MQSLRGELWVLLKEKTGLTYHEIARMDFFSALSIISLGTLYKRSPCAWAMGKAEIVKLSRTDSFSFSTSGTEKIFVVDTQLFSRIIKFLDL